MNSQTEKLQITGAAGVIEVLRDQPSQGVSLGQVVIAHPHPLFGGAMTNKVVQTLARAYVSSGWTALRFNFRGVGASEGVHDEGRGETLDMLEMVRQLAPQGPLALAGFSFGAFVTSQVVNQLWESRPMSSIVLVGTAASRFAVAPVPEAAHGRTLVIHGEQDETVALTHVMGWARAQLLPVMVVPGGGHFFHGQLGLLKDVVQRHIRGCV